MDKIVRWEFLGSWPLFWLLCVTMIGIPMAVLYLVDFTVRVEEQVTDAESALDAMRRASRLRNAF